MPPRQWRGKETYAITTWQDKNDIKIKIRDTGPGVPPEHVGKLFNPFFTTKEKGTGLGLAISYGIIERHSGKIDVETELGKGSTFTISLPIGNSEKDFQDETKIELNSKYKNREKKQWAKKRS